MADRAYDRPPEMALDPDKDYHANLLTEKGTIRIKLFAEEAPETVNNFVFLAREGYFDGTTFHRVIEGFMAQGGDPTGTGSGGPGYVIPDVATPWLDDRHAVFGEVVEGMDVVNAIRERDPQQDPEPGDTIELVEIEESAR